MGLFKKISNAFKKVVKVSTGGLIGGGDNSGQSAIGAPSPDPEVGLMNEDTNNTTESESEKQQLIKGKKRGKKSLKVALSGAGGTGRNIV